MSYNEREEGLESLLALEGAIFVVDESLKYQVKIRAYRVEEDINRPHGIKYSLTLHDENNQRILGFDNYHQVKISKGSKGKAYAFDHVHKDGRNNIVTYDFTTPGQLLEDFWNAVDQYLT